MYSTTIQNRRGDVTIAWDEPDDPKILQMIERQMAQGFDFWLLEPRLGGLAAPQKVRLTRAEDALRVRVVAMTLADGEDREPPGHRPARPADLPVGAERPRAGGYLRE